VVSETNEEKRAARFERLYTAGLLLVVALLLLLSILYTGRLWGVKAGLALGLLVLSGYFFIRARAAR
jgi:hypothetical protein